MGAPYISILTHPPSPPSPGPYPGSYLSILAHPFAPPRFTPFNTRASSLLPAPQALPMFTTLHTCASPSPPFLAPTQVHTFPYLRIQYSSLRRCLACRNSCMRRLASPSSFAGEGLAAMSDDVTPTGQPGLSAWAEGGGVVLRTPRRRLQSVHLMHICSTLCTHV